MPVGRPNDGLAVFSRLAKNSARLLAIRLHLPDFFMTVVRADKNNSRAIGRDGAAFGGVHELARCSTEDGDTPQAGSLGGRRAARRQHMGAVRKPTDKMGISAARYGDGMSFSSAHRAEKDACFAGESKV